MLENGDLITLSNNEEYIVISMTNLDGKNYVYLISKDGVSKISICLYENDTLTPVKDEEIFKLLLDKFQKEQNV